MACACPRARWSRARACTARDPLPRPYVLKPVNEGSSVGVAIVTEDGNYGNPIGRDVPGPWNEFDDLLAEPFIKGRELTVAVLNGEPLAVTELKIDNGFYDYEHKYTDGRTVHDCPADVPDDIAAAMLDMAAKAHRLLGCKGASRSDFRWDDRAGRGRPLSARNQHPAGHDPAQPGPRARQIPRHRLWRAGRAADRRGARMSAAHVRRGRVARAKTRKSAPKVGRAQDGSPSKLAGQPGARQPARGAGLRRLPARDGARRADRARHSGQGRARGRRRDRPGGLHRQRLSDRRPQQHGARADRRGGQRGIGAAPPRRARRAAAAGPGRCRRDPPAAAPLWLGQGRARARAGCPTHLVIDIVERRPAALWQNKGAAGVDRRRRRGARPRTDRPHARLAAADRPRCQRASRVRCTT